MKFKSKKHFFSLFGGRGYVGARGQMSAPFELFVAVIIMAFVVLIGSQVLATVGQQVCMNTVEKALSEFKVNIEDAVNYRTTKTFSFSPERCFDETKALIYVKKFDKMADCSMRCNQPVNSCYVLIFSATDISNGFRQKCLTLPKYLTLPKDFANTDNLCVPENGYTLLNVEDKIKLGTYSIKIVSAESTYPIVCVFYKP